MHLGFGVGKSLFMSAVGQGRLAETRKKLSGFKINTNGDKPESYGPKNKDGIYKLDELNSVVKGYIEVVVLDRYSNNDLLIMIVNEEGLLENLPVNLLASQVAQKPIVGDVLVCKSNSDGDIFK